MPSSVIYAILGGPTPTGVIPSAFNYVATNVGSPNVSTFSAAFLNAFKMAGGLYPPRFYNDTWSPNNNPAYTYDLNADANGYPISMTGLSATVYTSLVARLFFQMGYVGPTTYPPGMNANLFYPPGQYTFQFLGVGSITISGDAAIVAGGDQLVFTSTTPAGIRGTFTVTNATSTGLTITTTAIGNVTYPAPANYPHAISLVPTAQMGAYTGTGAGYNAATTPIQDMYSGGMMFHPDFKASLANYSNLRFMDWFVTNSQQLKLFLGPVSIPTTATSANMYVNNCVNQSNRTFTVAPTGTSGTLTSSLSAGSYNFVFSDGEVRAVTVATTGVGPFSWSPALTGSPTTAVNAVTGNSSVTPVFTAAPTGTSGVCSPGTALPAGVIDLYFSDNQIHRCTQTSTAITFTAAPTGTSGTITVALAAGNYDIHFSDGEIRNVTLATSTTSLTWTTALTGSPSTSASALPTTITWTGSITGTPTTVAYGLQILPWSAPSQSLTVVGTNGQPFVMNMTYGSEVVTWSAGAFSTPITYGGSFGSGQNYVPTIFAHVFDTWSKRPQVTDACWAGWKGIPYECAMQLCNEMSTSNGFPVDMWWNMPAHSSWNSATVSYDQVFGIAAANLALSGNDGSGVKLPGFTGLNSGSKIYLEWSNETWNFISSSYYMAAVGTYRAPASSSSAMNQLHGIELANVAQCFYGVFGDTAYKARIVATLGEQNAGSLGASQCKNQSQATGWTGLTNPATGSNYLAPYLTVGITGGVSSSTKLITACHIAPYLQSGGTSELSATDKTYLLSLSGADATYAASRDEWFACAYSNTGPSGHTYVMNSNNGGVTSVFTNGWAGGLTSQLNVFYNDTNFAGQPWSTYIRLQYEGGEGFYSDTGTAGWDAFLGYLHYDPRMAYVYYDPAPGTAGHLPTNPSGPTGGIIPASAAAGITFYNQYYSMGKLKTNQTNFWGACDDMMQFDPAATQPIATSCPKWQGIQNYIQA